MKRATLFACIACCLTVISNTARAQSPLSSDARGLTSTASETVTVKPNKLRLIMWIKAQGKDAKSAVLALNAHKEKVKKELASMKANAESVTFTSSRISAGNPNQEQRMIQMQMRAMRAGGGNSSPAPAPKVVTAMCALKAEWPLPVQEGDALVILPATLKEQIEARDLAGEKNKPELSEDEKEQMDEMEKMMEEQMGYYGSEENGNGTTIKFVGQISEADIAAATKKAFESAAAKAKSVSESTGVKLGKLAAVTSQANSTIEEMTSFMRSYSSYNSYSNQPPTFGESPETEVTSENTDDLKYAVMIGLIYDIE